LRVIGILTFFMLLLASIIALAYAPSLRASEPSQSVNTQVSYTIDLKGADQATLSIDGGTGLVFSGSKTITLDGSKAHQFQVQQVDCQSGWECGDKVTNWKNGKRLTTGQWTWSVPAGTIETLTQTYTGYYDEMVCVSSYEGSYGGSSCSSYYYIQVPYTQTSTQENFIPPCQPCEFTFQYTTQYRLVWKDNFSQALMDKWYDSCEEVSLQPPSGYSALGHPDTVAGAAGTQYVFNGWALDEGNSVVSQVKMCAPHILTASYLTQYQLQLGSQCPLAFQPVGAGWYNAGEQAAVRIEPYEPLQGGLGWLGGRYVFAGWTGPGGVIGSPDAQIGMTQAQSYTATCRVDYMMPAIVLVTVGAFGGGTGVYVMRGNGRFGPRGRWIRIRRFWRRIRFRRTPAHLGRPQDNLGHMIQNAASRGHAPQPTGGSGSGSGGFVGQGGSGTPTPNIQPGGQSGPSIGPGSGASTPKIGPGQGFKIEPGRPLGTPSQPTGAPTPFLTGPRSLQFCTKCGRKVGSKSRFCVACGTSLN
jgi:hypothetical protein